MKQGRVFTSGGPIINLEINGQPIGGTVHLNRLAAFALPEAFGRQETYVNSD